MCMCVCQPSTRPVLRARVPLCTATYRRQQILKQYAQHLTDADLAALAGRTGGMSGRDLRDVCEHTERRWASKVRGEGERKRVVQAGRGGGLRSGMGRGWGVWAYMSVVVWWWWWGWGWGGGGVDGGHGFSRSIACMR